MANANLPTMFIRRKLYQKSFFFLGTIYLTSFCSFCSTAILSACQYVGSTAPTVLPIRKAPLVLVYDPLDNHEIAFGVVHFALRCFPRWCARLTGSVLPTPARARMAPLDASPLRQRRFFRRKFVHPRTSAASAQSRLAQRLRPHG